MSQRVGTEITESPEIKDQIESLVHHVQRSSQKIEGPKSPNPARKETYQSLLDQVAENRGRPLFYPYVGSGAGRGAYVELEDGSVKLDLINGIGIHVLGHSHPQVMRAGLRGALSDSVVQGNLQPNLEYVKLGSKLVELASKKSRLAHAWITTSGSMANENALKMARQKNSPAKKIMAMKNAFAGRTTMMAELTDNPKYKVGLPEYHEILRVPFASAKNIQSCGDRASRLGICSSAEKSLNIMKEHVEKNKGDIAAFSFEPMQGEGGYKVGCQSFFIPLLKFCKENNIAVWADEVQTFARTGEFFAFETLGIGEYIDLCTIAKTVQNGATLYTKEYNPKPGLIAGTFAGSTVALASGLAIIEELESNGYMGASGKINQIHTEFVSMLNELNETTCKGLLQDAGGLGLMIAVTPLDGTQPKVMSLLKELYRNGMMAFACGRDPYRLRFLVPAVLTSEDIKVAKDILEKSLLKVNESN